MRYCGSCWTRGLLDEGIDTFGTSCAGDLDLSGAPRVGSSREVRGWTAGGNGSLYIGRPTQPRSAFRSSRAVEVRVGF